MMFRDKYFFLSNFYPCRIFYKDHSYSSAEHAYQAQKAMTEEERLRVALADTPATAKLIAKWINLRPDWDAVKDDIMLDVLKAKFSQHSDLRDRLIAIAEPIEEWNYWHDRYWGICLCRKCGTGYNVLGQLLEKVRAEV